MAVIHKNDPETGRPPPHVAHMPKLEMLKAASEQRLMMQAQNATMDLLIQVFNAGYEARENEERDRRAIEAEIKTQVEEEQNGSKS